MEQTAIVAIQLLHMTTSPVTHLKAFRLDGFGLFPVTRPSLSDKNLFHFPSLSFRKQGWCHLHLISMISFAFHTYPAKQVHCITNSFPNVSHRSRILKVINYILDFVLLIITYHAIITSAELASPAIRPEPSARLVALIKFQFLKDAFFIPSFVALIHRLLW